MNRIQVERLLRDGRLRYRQDKGWQVGYPPRADTPDDLEWFAVAEVDADLITQTRRELYAEGAALPACVQLETPETL